MTETPISKADREEGTAFLPAFRSIGDGHPPLVTAVVTDFDSGAVLMVAHMDEQAIAATRESRTAHFYSRSRRRLWMKGETSGHVLEVRDFLVDCDQDAIWLRVDAKGPTCHTNRATCFYRKLEGEVLELADSQDD